MTTDPLHETMPDGSTMQYWLVPTDEANLRDLFAELLDEHWNRLVLGPAIQGCVFECEFSAKPPWKYFDGYLTVTNPTEPHWHFHLCLGQHGGSPRRPTPPELQDWRRCSFCAFGRHHDPDGSQAAWTLELRNGRQEPMLTVWFPNPYLDDAKHAYTSNADWDKLQLWMGLRQRHAGIAPEPPPSQATPCTH